MPQPSLRFKIANLHGEMQTSRIEYVLGRNSRSEQRNCTGTCDGDPTQQSAVRFEYGPLRALIQNRALYCCFHLDLESQVYTASRINERGSPSWIKPRRPRLQPSGLTVHIHTQTCRHG